LGKHQAVHGIEDTELSLSNSSFDSGEEPGDEFDPNYHPSRHHEVDLDGDFLVRLQFQPHVYIVQWVG